MTEYISREAAINTINAYYDGSESTDRIDKALNELWNKAVHHIGSSVSRIPAADVKPVVRGEWKQTGNHSAVCTACGKTTFVGGVDRTGKALIHKGLFHFCPNCGADMRNK